ncbi:MAG: ATP-dependent helicase [Patescibacteria group bacterium]|jgi:DNA helicase-2/ATP-dependent DNA helicase PcrA
MQSAMEGVVATQATVTSRLLDALNPEQRLAAETLDGPVLILAGAGSGKTKTLTHRVAHLVERGVSPANILAVTFTNKAAGEMRERLSSLCAEYLPGRSVGFPWLGTFHSVCVRILRRSIGHLGYKASFTIYDASDSQSLIKSVMGDLGIDPKTNNPRTVQSFISGAKNELMGPSEYEAVADGYFMETVAKVYHRYQAALKEANALDFDDLLILTARLFAEYPEVLQDYQAQFKYVLVDEYQDTNLVQYRLVKALASHGNICVVGDDYQAIYGWRGANFRNILNFEKDWPNACVVKLEQNYRSTQVILDAADAVIKNNYQRTDKKLWSEKKEGAPVTVYEAVDGLDEVDFVATEIASLRRHYPSLNSFTVLYRTNAQSRALEECFMKRELPYRLVGAVRFYERKEVKDMMAYLRVIANPADVIAFERASGAPARGIGKKTMELVRTKGVVAACEEHVKLKNFATLLESFRTYATDHDVAALIDYVAEHAGYREYLLDGTDEGEGRWENIQELKSVAEGYPSLQEFLEATSLISDVDNYDPKHEAVTLMTMHNAKGLEFPVVFIVGCEEGIFPHSRALADPAQMEEERRLCYVGMTRAKERLYMLSANSRLIYGGFQANPSSRFLSEIPDHLKERL